MDEDTRFTGYISETDIEDEMRRSYMEFAMSTIVGRALPDVRDGLKPVHRRILFAMKEMGNTHDKPYKKSARIVGDVMGKYHPHGDQAIYDTIVRMAQPFSMRHILIDGQGNFGSVDGDAAAAMRYTEIRLDKLAEQMLIDIDKNTVDFRPNYDNSLREPVLLPAKFPNLLVNGSSGIAVGMATNIPPHNLGEIIDALVHIIENPACPDDDILKIIPGPDFPTGGFIYGIEGIAEAYRTGRGRIRMRAKAYIETGSTRDSIIVTEIPYQVNKSNLLMRIADLVKSGKLEDIADLRDESDRAGMRIVVELKRSAQPEIVLNRLFKHTQMEETFGIIMLALKDGQPLVMSLREMMDAFLEHLRRVVVRRTQFDLNKAEEKAHLLEGLKKALDNIDLVVKIIRGSRTSSEAQVELIKKLAFSELQAKAILDMRLARLTGLERDKLVADLEDTRRLIEYLSALLADPQKIWDVIKKELTELKDKFADPRRTTIIGKQAELSPEDLIADEKMVVSITHQGYIKRTPVDTYRRQKRGGIGVAGMTTKEEDFVEHLFIATNHDTLLFFTAGGMVYSMKVYEIPEAGRTAKGMAVINLIQMNRNDKVASMLAVRNFSSGRSIVFVSKMGIIKRTHLSDFAHIKKTGIIAMKLRDSDELITCALLDGERDILLVTSQGKSIRFHSSDLRAMGRNTQGVIGIRLREGDAVVAMTIPQTTESVVLLVSERGNAKRTRISDFRLQSRGGYGVIAMRVNDKTGKLIAVKEVENTSEIVAITSEGVVLRTTVSNISIIGRATQGVRLIRLREGQYLSSIARVPEDEEIPPELPDDDNELLR